MQGLGATWEATLLSTVTWSPAAVKLTGPGPSVTLAKAAFTAGGLGPSMTTLFSDTDDRFSGLKPISVTTESGVLPGEKVARTLFSMMFLNSGISPPSSLL